MRLNINLATQPYRDIRRHVHRWAISVVLMALITSILVYAAATAVFSWRNFERQKGQLEAQIREQNQIRMRAEAVMNEPANRTMRDQSQFINQLIARKAFSWTEVMSDLERMVPSGIQVTSIKPQINDQNQLVVLLTVSGQSRERAVDLVRRMEESPHFRYAQLQSEAATRNQQGNELNFSISALYVPSWEQAKNAPAGKGGL